MIINQNKAIEYKPQNDEALSLFRENGLIASPTPPP